MNRKKWYLLFTSLLLVMMMSMTASAKWVSAGNGKYIWKNNKGKKLTSMYYPSAKAGLVKEGKTWYGYDLDNTYHKGWLRANGKTWYISNKGTLVMNKWFKLDGHQYYIGSNGQLPKAGLRKVGKYSYLFTDEGYVLYGKQKVGKNFYFFNTKNGRMVVKKLFKYEKEYYYVDAKGVMARNKRVGKYYFMADCRMARNLWGGKRYYGGNGKYLTGLQTLDGKTYYFDEKTGNKLVSTKKVVKGVTYVFDANGVGTKAGTVGQGGEITLADGVRVEGSYKTDPKVSEEDFLAAIIYAESGNQPGYGQIAVGTVIMNRVKSSQFPNDIREVVYQDQQFEPTRNGSLTRYLKNPDLISATAKKAAQIALQRAKVNKAYVVIAKKKIDLRGVLFFMTPAAYQRLGLKAPVTKIKDHVFFKNWA